MIYTTKIKKLVSTRLGSYTTPGHRCQFGYPDKGKNKYPDRGKNKYPDKGKNKYPDTLDKKIPLAISD
jgi:hypothetical protein